MDRIKINYETVESVYIIYDKKHKYMDVLAPETDIKQYMEETLEAGFYEKLPIFDTIIYCYDDEENVKSTKKNKKRISA